MRNQGRGWEPWPLSQQPAHRKLPTRAPLKPRAAPQPPAALQTGALSKGGAQGAEAGGHCIYLTLFSFSTSLLASFFFFFFNSLQTETVKS